MSWTQTANQLNQIKQTQFPTELNVQISNASLKGTTLSPKKRIYVLSNRKINFQVSLTVHCSNLLNYTNNYIKNAKCVNLYPADPNGDLKANFADVSFDTFRLFVTILKQKLSIEDSDYEVGNKINNAETIEVDQ